MTVLLSMHKSAPSETDFSVSAEPETVRLRPNAAIETFY